MIVIVVLIASFLLFRIAGALGVSTLSSSVASARWALATMFLFTGIAHFTPAKNGMARMVPAVFANPLAIVYFTGICEIAGAIGLLFPRTRVLAALCFIVFLVAVFPANAKAAREHLLVAGKPATAIWLRAPIQLVFMGLAWWVSRY